MREERNEEEEEEGNAGMAAVMANILGKSVPGNKTTTIMSKAISEKQLASRKRKHELNAPVRLNPNSSALICYLA